MIYLIILKIILRMKFRLNSDNSKLILIESTKGEYNQLKLYLTRFVNNHRFMKRVKLGVWDGKISYMGSPEGNILFGLWGEIYKCCKEYGYPFIIENKEQFPRNNDITKEQVQEFVNEFYKDHKASNGNPFMPYEHQVDAIFKILKHKYGIVEIATAGGKSLVFGTLVFYYLKYINPDAKFLLIVPNISLVTQFYNDLNDYNYGFNSGDNKNPLDIRIDEVMSDKPRKYRDEEKKPNIFIGTYQSLEKYPKEFFTQFQIVACDEAHTAKAQSLITILTKTFGSADIRYGMSGTYPSDASVEILTIESLMGPKLVNISAKSLIDKGLISDLKIKAILLHHDNHKFAEGVYKIRKNDGRKAYDLEREYVHNSSKRKTFVKNLVDKFKSNSLLLFNTITYGTEIYNYLKDNCQNKDVYYIDGSVSGEKREYIKKQMEITDGNPKILVASFGTLSTGVSIKAITNIIMLDSYKSSRVVLQSIGRGLRLHAQKTKLIVFDLVDIFHSDFKTILWRQYDSRKTELYKKQQYPLDEIKVKL